MQVASAKSTGYDRGMDEKTQIERLMRAALQPVSPAERAMRIGAAIERRIERAQMHMVLEELARDALATATDWSNVRDAECGECARQISPNRPGAVCPHGHPVHLVCLLFAQADSDDADVTVRCPVCPEPAAD